MEISKKLVSIAAIISMSAVLISGCSGSAMSSQPSDEGSSEAVKESTVSSGEETAADNGLEPIKIGTLFSASGTQAITEDICSNVVSMIADEVNASGGINGRELIVIKEDNASDATIASEKAKKLILDDEVSAIIGACTSASKNAVKPIVEENNSLLIYPNSYEGEIPSPNIVYSASIAYYHWEILIPWLMENYGDNIFFIYTDSTGSGLMARSAMDVCTAQGGQVVGDEAVPSGHTDFSTIINKITAAEPDAIVSVLWNDSEAAFYKQLANYGISQKDLPVAGVSADENIYKAVGQDAEGAVLCTTYINTLDNPVNNSWKEEYYAAYGTDYELNAFAELTYVGTKLLVESLKSIDDGDYSSENIMAHMDGLEIDAPEGKVIYDGSTHHCSMTFKIGVVNSECTLDVIYESEMVKQDPAEVVD